jgi:Delta7-sterol 5-desaturase
MSNPAHPLLMFVQGFFGQAITYFAIVGFFYWVLWMWGEQRFRHARIQDKKRVDGKQIAFEIKNTFIVFLASAPMTSVVSYLYSTGGTKLTTDASVLGWPTIIASFFALIILNDAWFYAWHRLLHHPKLFRYVHAVHHKSVDVNPFSSYSFHWFEGVILGAWVLPVALFVPVFIPMLGALAAIGLINNVMSHLGYEFFPRGLMRVPLLRWINTSTFHNLHHSSFRGNYGLMFRFWDRMLGTELPNYEEKFVERKGSL